MSSHASAYTWGISGPAFIRGYVIAAVAVLVITLALRYWAQRGRPTRRGLHPYEVAYLAGGSRRAIGAALAALRLDGAVEAAGHGRLRSTGAPAGGSRAPLEQALLRQIEHAAALDKLAWRSSVQQAVGNLRDGLVRDGLAPRSADRVRAKAATLPMVALLGLGLVRLVAGMRDGHPVGYLVVALLVIGSMTVFLFFRPVRFLRAGQAAVRRARAESGHLAPEMSPAWQTYGASRAALAVAVFGAPALLSVDRSFAVDSGVVAELRLWSSDGSGSSGRSLWSPGFFGSTWAAGSDGGGGG